MAEPGSVALTVSSDGGVRAVPFSPDSALLAIADLDQVLLRSSTTSDVVWRGPVEGTSSVNAVRFTPDGKTLVAATDLVVQAVNVADGPGRCSRCPVPIGRLPPRPGCWRSRGERPVGAAAGAGRADP